MHPAAEHRLLSERVSFAEFVKASARYVVKVTEGVDPLDAAALHLRRRHDLQGGQRLRARAPATWLRSSASAASVTSLFGVPPG